MITAEEKEWAKGFLQQCENKISTVMHEIKTDYPYRPIDGKYDTLKLFPFSWTCGFWSGIMWLLYNYTGKEQYKKRAVACSERTSGAFSAEENYNCLDNHDLGFVFLPTSVAHYRICGDEKAKIRGLHAATMLAGRFNLKGNYIRAWRNGILGNETKGYAIIDCLMNLPLLFWASEECGDVRFSLFAKAHADTVLREFVKSDGSVYHIVNFNSETGAVKDYPRGQGYASGSAWSRGQAWGIYGFTLLYIHTGEKKYLDAAKRVAEFVMEHMGGRSLAPSDYMQPDFPDISDASASAVTASGMLELARACESEGEKYSAFAIRLLKGLYNDCDFTAENQAIVQSATEMYHGERKHIPLIYADYFLIEALIKCIGKDNFLMW